MTPAVVKGPMPAGMPHVAVAIIGAGACGLTAALALHDAGVDCVVLERDRSPSGSTALSSGLIPAASTHAQRSQGISDTPEGFAADIQAKAHGTAAGHLVTAYCEAIGPALDALEVRHGIEFEVLDSFLYPGHEVHRMHCVPEKTGVGLMTRLQRAMAAAEVPIVTQALVRELWRGEGGRITGLGYERADGQKEYLSCDVLILACNGFGGNGAMVREFLPEMRDAIFAGHTGNDGTAISWGKQLGARLADLGGYQGHGSWAVPQGVLITWALMMKGAIQLNARGERFHDETQGYSEAAVQVLAQPGGVAWNVFDDALLQVARSFPDFCEAEAAGAVKRCEDVSELARLIGCDAINMDANNIYSTGAKPQLDQQKLSLPLYAVKVTGALFHTQGGLDIDARCRVLHEDGSCFANLLAAGGAARGVSGNAVWGYLSGNGLLSAVAGGAIAARTASQMLQQRSQP